MAYLLIVDVGQDTSQDLQKENTQKQHKVLRTQKEQGRRNTVIGQQ